MARRKLTQNPDGSTSGHLGVRDVFTLIRHLARSQSDPRKAVAELVQNALDEQASRITIERRRDKGEAMLSIVDDGRGVLPELPRAEALASIARNIGHSRKRALSFEERMRQAMLGQYGIGILGFWSVGHEFRMISRVAGADVWCLTMWEDSPKFEVERSVGDFGRGPTWTEVQIHRLHNAAMGPTVGSRLASYLSVELQGQLLRHGTEIEIIDRIARGAADKHIRVMPAELAGERLEGLNVVPVPGFERPLELQLFYAGDAKPGSAQVKLSCAGAVVLDHLGDHPDFARPPWTDGRIAGIIDFAHLEVPPGSRRGIVPNDAFMAFCAALAASEAEILAKIREKEDAEVAKLSAETHRQLARLFQRATDLVPHLEWLPVAKKAGGIADAPPEGSTIGRPGGAPAETPEEDEGEAWPTTQPEMFPPGPLAEVVVGPKDAEIAFGQTRRFRAKALDARGQRISQGVTFEWSVSGPAKIESTDGERAVVRAFPEAGAATVKVLASEGDVRLAAETTVKVVSALRPKRGDAGIPQPEEVNEPLETWRSRSFGERWEVNVGHSDYKALAEDPRRKLRYLAYLLSKEIIARNFPRPELGQILEEMVGLLSALERSGGWSRIAERE